MYYPQSTDGKIASLLVSCKYIMGLISKETVVLRRWGVETNVWFTNRVDNFALTKG